MAKQTTKTVKLSQLREAFYVRTGLDQDHAIKLADLYVAGEKMPPIEITSDNRIVDGRHRKEAMELAFGPEYETQATVVSEHNMVDLIAHALRANEGGSKTPTRADIIHTIQLLLREGASERRVYEVLPYPKDATRKYLDDAKRRLFRWTLIQARQGVAEGLTVREAARKFNLDEKDLRLAITGRKTRAKSGDMTQLLRGVTNRFYALSRANQALVKRIVLAYVDGNVQDTAVDSVLNHIESLSKRQIRNLNDWRKRYTAAKEGRLVNWKDTMPEPNEGEAEEAA